MSEERFSRSSRLAVGDIAALAGVRPSAVSNWRKRHTDFPPPVESTAGGDLFERGAITAWLRRHGKSQLPPESSVELSVWSLMDGCREWLGQDRSVLFLMQLIALRVKLQSTAHPPNNLAPALWSSRPGDDVVARWEGLRHALAAQDPELARVLELPRGVRHEHLQQAIDAFLKIDHLKLDWGQVATALLRRYQEAAGARGGYFATSESITRLIVGLIEGVGGTIYDPAAGLGMVLAEVWKQSPTDQRELIAQEVDEHSWRLGYLHLVAIGARFKFFVGDTLRGDRCRDLRADAVVVDPPLGQKMDLVFAPGDDRWPYGIPRASTEWVWAQHLLSHLAKDGIGVMVTPLGALVRGGIESRIRRSILEEDLVDAVIELPPGLTAGTQGPLTILVFERRRTKRALRTLFIDARQLGTMRRGKGRELAAADVERILKKVLFWRKGHSVEEPRFASVATTARIAETEFDLSPSRYVGYEAASITSIDGEPIEDRLERLVAGFDTSRAGLNELLEKAYAGAQAFERLEESNWPSVRLGDLLTAEPRTGVRQDSGKQEGPELPFVSTRLVSGGPGYLEVVPSETSATNVRDRLVTEGDLLLVARGIDPAGAARCATVRFRGEATYAESLIRLRVDRLRVEPDFVRLFLTSRSGRALLAAVTTGSVIANLRASALVEIRVPLPPLDEQRRIAAAVADVERGVAALARAQNDADALLDTLREGIASGMYNRPES